MIPHDVVCPTCGTTSVDVEQTDEDWLTIDCKQDDCGVRTSKYLRAAQITLP